MKAGKPEVQGSHLPSPAGADCRPFTVTMASWVKSSRQKPEAILVFDHMRHRFASFEDAEVLGELNHQLIEDEGHRNPMMVPELANRMRRWLEADFRASIFEDDSGIVAYALHRDEQDHLYLRQFFVQRHRRRAGIGRQCAKFLISQVWPKDKRIRVDVLCQNQVGIAFWRAVGFTDYCLTLEIYPRKF